MALHQASTELLASCLQDVLRFIKPIEEDQLKRQRTIDELNTLLQSMDIFRNATIKPFGSYISNLYTKWGDLDIAIQISNSSKTMVPQDRKRYYLKQLWNALRRTGLGYNFQYIPHARVPLLICESWQQKISCDISIDNHLVHIKSKFLLWISQMDARFRDLVLLVKLWAKVHKINNAKSGTLNSYSLCLLVIFHLQTCKPAILPPLREIYGGNISHDVKGMGSVAENYIKQTCDAAIASFRTTNKASVSELLISFFQKFSEIRNKSSQYAICTFTGRWENTHLKTEWMGKSYDLIIEDPFDLPENAARSVGATELVAIASAFSETYWELSSSHVRFDRQSLLDCLVGSDIRRQLDLDARVKQRPSYNMGGNQSISTVGTNSAKIYGTLDHRFESNSSAQQSSKFISRRASPTDIYQKLDHHFASGLEIRDDGQTSASTLGIRRDTANWPDISRPHSGMPRR